MYMFTIGSVLKNIGNPRSVIYALVHLVFISGQCMWAVLIITRGNYYSFQLVYLAFTFNGCNMYFLIYIIQYLTSMQLQRLSQLQVDGEFDFCRKLGKVARESHDIVSGEGDI